MLAGPRDGGGGVGAERHALTVDAPATSRAAAERPTRGGPAPGDRRERGARAPPRAVASRPWRSRDRDQGRWRRSHSTASPSTVAACGSGRSSGSASSCGMSGTVTRSACRSAFARSAAASRMAGSSPFADDDLDRHRGLVGAGDEIELVGDLRGRRVPGVGDAEAALVRGHDRTQRGDRADEHLGDDVVPVDGHQLRHGRAQRPAQQRERAGEAEPVGQLGVGGRELGAGLRGDRAEVVDHRVLVGQPHVLVGVDAPRRVHRQAEVDPPRVEAREGQRRGHGGLGTRRVGEVPRHDDGRFRPLVLRRDDDGRNSVSQLHAVQYTGRCTVAQCRVAPDSGRA